MVTICKYDYSTVRDWTAINSILCWSSLNLVDVYQPWLQAITSQCLPRNLHLWERPIASPTQRPVDLSRSWKSTRPGSCCRFPSWSTGFCWAKNVAVFDDMEEQHQKTEGKIIESSGSLNQITGSQAKWVLVFLITYHTKRHYLGQDGHDRRIEWQIWKPSSYLAEHSEEVQCLTLQAALIWCNMYQSGWFWGPIPIPMGQFSMKQSFTSVRNGSL